MNGFTKSLGIAVVAVGLGVSYAPSALARGTDTWKVDATSLTNIFNASDWDDANSFSITWDYYLNDYTPLTFLKIGNQSYHDETGGDFLATNEWVPGGLKWVANMTQTPGLSYSIFLQNWNPSGPSGQLVSLSVLELFNNTPQKFGITNIPTHAYIKASVPEPSSLLGLTLLGAIGSTLARKKQKTTEIS